jgi:uncharacterized protein (TIGR02270 family)
VDQGGAIRWDVYEEHLDEAGFLSALWEKALTDPEYTLAEVAAGPEERVLGHLDGLVLGGRKVAERLLVPALAGDDAGVVLAAAWALLLSEDGDQARPVLDALSSGEPEQVAAATRALQLAPRPDLAARLSAPLASRRPEARAAALDVLAAWRADAAGPLEPFLASPDAAVRRAALRLGRALPARLTPHLLEPSLSGDEPEERDLAIAAGLVAGARSAWALCERIVRDGGPAWSFPALLYASSGAQDLAPLTSALEDPERRKAALFALGFTGRMPAADAAAAHLGDRELGRLAGEAFSAITGVDIGGALSRAPERWDPDAPEEDEAEVAGDPAEAALPSPEAAPILAWWQEARKGLDPGARYLGGAPWSAEALLGALERAPMRRRPPLALDLAVRTRGAAQVDARGLARRQLEELGALRAMPPRARAGAYGDPAGSAARAPRGA